MRGPSSTSFVITAPAFGTTAGAGTIDTAGAALASGSGRVVSSVPPQPLQEATPTIKSRQRETLLTRAPYRNDRRIRKHETRGGRPPRVSRVTTFPLRQWRNVGSAGTRYDSSS